MPDRRILLTRQKWVTVPGGPRNAARFPARRGPRLYKTGSPSAAEASARRERVPAGGFRPRLACSTQHTHGRGDRPGQTAQGARRWKSFPLFGQAADADGTFQHPAKLRRADGLVSVTAPGTPFEASNGPSLLGRRGMPDLECHVLIRRADMNLCPEKQPSHREGRHSQWGLAPGQTRLIQPKDYSPACSPVASALAKLPLSPHSPGNLLISLP